MIKKISKIIAIGAFLLSSSVYANSVFVYANQSGGFVGKPAYVSSQHKVRIYNGRDITVHVTYHYRLCVQNDVYCTWQDVPVTVPPHSGVPDGQGWTDQKALVLEHTFPYSGNYQVHATTMIDGDDGTIKTESYSTISIY